MKSKHELRRFSIPEHNDECVGRLTSDFPDILNPNYVDSVLTGICRQAGIERKHTISLDGILEGTVNSVTVIRKLLPSIYCLCLTSVDGEDKWPALRKSYIILNQILWHLKTNMESALNEHFEQSVNIGIHGKEEFGVELSRVLASLERKYKFQLKRGPKGTKGEKRNNIKSIYNELVRVLRPGFSGGTKKYECCYTAVEWCNEQLEYTLNVGDVADKMWTLRSSKEAATRLTALCSKVSESTVRRNIK
jgi:hypothetical protein